MSDGVRVDVEMITPTIAKQLLDGSAGNFRCIDRGRVAKYAAEMTAGRWNFNGETIKLNGTMIIDGQHRLAAIVKSDVAVKCIVIRNLDKTAGMTIDCGKGRTIADWVRFRQLKNANSITAMSRQVMAYKHGKWGLQTVPVGVIKDSEIIDYVEANNDLLQATHNLVSACHAVVQRSFLGSLMLIACDGKSPADNPLCNWFCKSLQNGIGLSEGEPVLALRNKFVGVEKARKESPFLQKMLLTLAWNKTVKGEPVKCLKYALTGPTASKPINTIELAPWE
jgi:hypothetical protein